MDAITITQALNTIQSWLNTGNFDKAIQGCQEVLKLDPGNLRASSLMRQAEERRFLNANPQATEPMTPNFAPEPEPKLEPMTPNLEPVAKPTRAEEIAVPVDSNPTRPETHDPLLSLQTEDAHPINTFNRPFSGKVPELNRSQRFFAMAIPAVIIIGLGGIALTLWGISKRDDSIQEALTPPVIEETQGTPEYLKNNQKRIDDLKKIGEV